jgi:nucleoside-diphosphate kinase
MVTSEKTFAMVKPDGVVRGLTGEIIRRIEQRGLKIVAIRMFHPTREQIDGHYPKNDDWVKNLGNNTLLTYTKYGYDVKEHLGTDDLMEVGKMVRGWLIDFMVSGPVVTMVIEGLHAIDMVRKLVGATTPANADVGTIRGDFSVDSPLLANLEKRCLSNIIHASGTPEEAEHEIHYWFKPEEIVSYQRGELDVLMKNMKK